jgi:hypothetical protein
MSEFGRRGMVAPSVGSEPSSLKTGSWDDSSSSVSGPSVRRPRFRSRDRIFWLWLARLWAGWRASLVIVQPATVLAWHRQGFQLYWRWKSRRRSVGRPPLDLELRTLILCRSEIRFAVAVHGVTKSTCPSQSFPGNLGNRPEGAEAAGSSPSGPAIDPTCPSRYGRGP